MKLADLTAGLEYTVLQGTEDKDVTALIYFSEKAVPGCLFFAVAGTEENGLDYAEDAVCRGACTVVTEEVWYSPQKNPDVTVLLVENVRKTMGILSCRFFGNPCGRMMTVGITGTKGKTSTAFMLQEILETAGIPAGMIGTVKNGWAGSFLEAEQTTPQSVDVQKWCRRMEDWGCKALVMEVSSQGMKQYRAEGIRFDMGIFTNLRADHIGPQEHETFEEYAACKGRLFRQCRTAVFNADEKNWETLLPKESGPKLVTFGWSSGADYRCRDIKPEDDGHTVGVSFWIGEEQLYVSLPGALNAVNAAGAAAAARELGVGWPAIREALRRVQVPGRLEQADTGGKSRVFIDYAHNGFALRQVLLSLRQYEPEKLILVFGCGGNRDRNRRREMGRAAAELADLTIVTSDNPRWEDPGQIINDITDSMDAAVREGASGRYLVEPDRKKAIFLAVTEGRKRDMILIAGKGHETCQLVKGEKIYFDDRKTAEEAARLTGQNDKNQIMGEKKDEKNHGKRND